MKRLEEMGAPVAGMGAPALHAASAPKHFRAGTHRLVSPELTLERVRPLMRRMGITRLANVTGLDTPGVPVALACRPNARSLSVSQGKGLTLAAAKASALMEAVELYHAEHLTLPLRLASFNELRARHQVAQVSALPRVSVGAFHENLRLLWVEGRDLVRDAPVWVPLEVVHMNFTLPLPEGSGHFLMGSNGLASGNHPQEAISHGLCELVERDALTLWLHRKEQGRTRLELSTVDDPACREVLVRLERAEVEVAVWEITSDVSLPAFWCRIVDRAPNPHRPIASAAGSGCHPSRAVALLRALTEAAQSRLAVIAGSRDDLQPGRAEATCQEARRALEAFRASPPARSFQDAPDHERGSFEEDIALELDLLRARGLEQILVVDLTQEEFGIPVIRVVVPGLEGVSGSAGFVPGARLQALMKEQSA